MQADKYKRIFFCQSCQNLESDISTALYSLLYSKQKTSKLGKNRGYCNYDT